MTLLEKWRGAMADVQLKHIDPTCTPIITVYGDDARPTLIVVVGNCRDTTDQEMRRSLTVSCVALTYWPGATLAQQWIAAAWAGYIQHEALELVLVAGIRPLDPHGPGFIFDRGLRQGFPAELTPETLERTLTLVMDPVLAAEIVRNGGTYAH